MTIPDSIPTIHYQTTSPPWETSLNSEKSYSIGELQSRIEYIEADLKAARDKNHELAHKLHNLNIDYKESQKNLAKYKKAALAVTTNVNKVRHQRITNFQKKQIVRDALKGFMSHAQINWLFTKGKKFKRGFKWSTEDITLALTIKNLSARTYRFLRKNKIVPLPGPETIRRFFKDFIIQEGHFEQVHTLLALMAEDLTIKERICTLSFDEVSVKADLSLDVTSDSIIGPCSQANTLVVRGIYGNYKVPIGFWFDKKMSKEILHEAITAMEAAGFHVISICSDMGPKNTDVRSSLGVTLDEPWFNNPVREGSRIFWLHDIPHITKNLRKQLLKGIVLPSGAVIGKPLFEKLYTALTEKNLADLDPSKVTRRHLDVSGQDEQKVNLATELCSQTNADIIMTLFPDDELMQQLAEFISDTNSFFDIFNSTKEYHPKNPLGHAYGISKEEQDSHLAKFLQTVKGLRAVWDNEDGYKKSMQPWQHGIIFCINAIKPLFEDLQKQYKIEFIPTYREVLQSYAKLF